jgi:hypothetical protein
MPWSLAPLLVEWLTSTVQAPLTPSVPARPAVFATWTVEARKLPAVTAEP